MAGKKGISDHELLREIQENFQYDTTEWKHIREEADVDMRYVSGDPWDPNDKADRKNTGRPALGGDELGQYFNQVINEARLNPRAAKFDPTGDGANDKTARFYADKWREIEYRSRAQIVYTTALQNSIHRSYGWARVRTKRTRGSFNQEIWLEEFVNPDLVLPDTTAKRPTFSDMQHCFVIEQWKQRDFKRRWPNAKIQNFADPQVAKSAWVNGDMIQVGEYWRVEQEKRFLLAIRRKDGTEEEGIEGEIKVSKSDKILRREEEDVPKVTQYLTNGLEILEKHDWPGEYIPIIGCVGLMLYLNLGSGTKRYLLSMTRLARDPFMLLCYYRSAQAELVGMTPKTPAIGYKGQFRNSPETWQKAAHEPVAYLEADALTEATGQQILPLPQFRTYDPPIERLEIGAEAARRGIQAAMGGAPLPTSAQRRNEKSGVALKQIDATQQKGNFHFLDHYEDFIQHCAVVGEDLIDKIYDSKREVGIREANGNAKVVTINDLNNKDAFPTKGRHTVTIGTGPSFESEREAASDFADTLATIPNVFPLIAPLIVKLKNLGPIGDEISEKLKFLQPPEMRDTKEGEEPDPRELMAQLAQASEQIKMAEAAIQQLVKEKDGKVIENRTKYDIAVMQVQADLEKERITAEQQIELQRMKDATSIRVAEIAAETKGIQTGHELQHEADALARTQAHEVGMLAMQQTQADDERREGMAHEAGMTEADQTFQAQQAAAAQEAGASAEAGA